MDFSRMLAYRFGSFQRPVPLRNSFGPVYPTFHDAALVELLGIGPEERVLDIGGGQSPFARANVVTEPYLDQSAHRGGQAVRSDIRYVECFAEDLPFEEKEFDFAIARQVFEHVNDPFAACREIMRVARRGFIETPQRNYDILMGPNPSHQWLVSVRENRLLFERRRFIRHPFRHIGLSMVPSSPEGQFLIHTEFKNLSNVQFYWEGEFEFQVLDDGDGFDYRNPDHAAEAHLDSALGSLFFPGSPPAHREADAREALRHRPDWALAHNTLGILLWRQGRAAEAIEAFGRAVSLEPEHPAYRHNSALKSGESPEIAGFTDHLPMDVAFAKEFLTPSGFDMVKLLRGPA